jgi:hypothetical protein
LSNRDCRKRRRSLSKINNLLKWNEFDMEWWNLTLN